MLFRKHTKKKKISTLNILFHFSILIWPKKEPPPPTVRPSPPLFPHTQIGRVVSQMFLSVNPHRGSHAHTHNHPHVWARIKGLCHVYHTCDTIMLPDFDSDTGFKFFHAVTTNLKAPVKFLPPVFTRNSHSGNTPINNYGNLNKDQLLWWLLMCLLTSLILVNIPAISGN